MNNPTTHMQHLQNQLEKSKHFNGLTPKQAEILAIIAEEAGEVVQAVTKILRHGLKGKYDNGIENFHALEIEIGDLSAIVQLAGTENLIDNSVIADCAIDKYNKLHKFMHHYGDDE